MLDGLMLLCLIVFFGLTYGLVMGCQELMEK
jgi:hypothetical protein